MHAPKQPQQFLCCSRREVLVRAVAASAGAAVSAGPLSGAAAPGAPVAGADAAAAAAAASAATVRESLAKAAERLPGGGAADIYYPDFFGPAVWTVRRVLTKLDVATPDSTRSRDAGGDRDNGAAAAAVSDVTRVLGGELARLRLVAELERPIEYRERYMLYNDRLVADRGFNAQQRTDAELRAVGVPAEVDNVRWSASNPNVLAVETRSAWRAQSRQPPSSAAAGREGRALGLVPRVQESKVTRRHFESQQPMMFESSEFARVASATRDSAAAQVYALRTRTRYKLAAAAPSPSPPPPSSLSSSSSKAIDALQLCYYYLPPGLAAATSWRARARGQQRAAIVAKYRIRMTPGGQG